MTNLFLLNDDVNVIVTDWGGGSSGLYSQTAANTRLVGLEVAALIDYLLVRFDQCYLIIQARKSLLYCPSSTGQMAESIATR